MALAATTVWEVQTGGSDTVNGGAFDPGQTAGMFTDGAATSATGNSPVFSSASYNFVAGDVGAWVYISSGTNWTAGWYKIASVGSNQATLNAAIGAGVLKTTFVPTTAAGCATTASPTNATWTIDYSQQAAAQYSYTDLVSAGAGLTVSSVAKPFAKEQVGNSIIITGGTNFNTGTYVIASVAAGVATVVGPTNITSGVGANGTGGQGGALASPGALQEATHGKVANNQTFIKAGTYNITTASTNVSGGCISDALANTTVANHLYEGYNTVRGDLGTAPILLAGNSISTFTILNIATAGADQFIRNITFDGASLTSARGVACSRRMFFQKCTAKNCTNDGFNISGLNVVMLSCVATGCATTGNGFNISGAIYGYACESYSNSVGGFNFSSNTPGILTNCLSYANSGASSDGFLIGAASYLSNCVAYNNGRDGFRQSTTNSCNYTNCIAESNTGTGFNGTGTLRCATLKNCAGFSSGTNVDATGFPFQYGFVTGSGSFFTNPGAGDFSLNNTAGAGAAARAAGFPGVYPTGTTTGYLDIGGAQHQDPASGGGGLRLAGRGGLAMGA